MAYDKLCDSAALDAGLKSIADAIRAKAGTSDNLAFPTAMAEAIAAIQAGGGNTLWNGGKFTMGSFIPTAVLTSEYVIATSSDNAMLDLLNDGETLNGIYDSIALLVVRKTKSVVTPASQMTTRMGSAISFPTYYGDGAGRVSYYQYFDSYGSARCSTNIAAKVSYSALSIVFSSSAIGSPDDEYLWIAWRCVI